jgi:hypothetical protein
MPASLIQRQKSSAKKREMVTPRVGCWPKFEPTIHTRFSRNNHFTYNPVSHKWVGVERFPLLGMSQGCAVAIAFAVRHPQRVSHLVLYGGFAVGRRKRPNVTDADRERFAAMVTLMKLGWGADNPTFRQMFTSLLLPTATREHADAFNELQRKSASPECAVRYFETVRRAALGIVELRTVTALRRFCLLAFPVLRNVLVAELLTPFCLIRDGLIGRGR